MRTSFIVYLLLLALPAGIARGQVTLLSSLENDHTLAPGGTHTGTMTIRNTSDLPRDVRVYQMDAQYGAAGSKYLEPGSTPRSNAEWISFAPSSFTVPPFEDYTVTYTVAVPEGDSLRGSYWSILMLESAVSSPQAANSSGSDGRVRLGVKFRYAVQIAAHIGGGDFEAALEHFEADVTDDGRSILQIDVANEGERMGRPVVWVELYDDAGALVGKYDGVEKRMYPGSVSRQVIEVGSPASGEYRALVLVDAGSDALFGAQYTLKF